MPSRQYSNVLSIAEVDILDGTPLLDIKPYLPAFDRFPVERVGWYETSQASGTIADARFELKLKERDIATGGK